MSDVNTIINFCNTSLTFKKYRTDQLWKNIAIREGMAIDSTVKSWLDEYLYHQYEVNILKEMIKDKVILSFNLSTSFLYFNIDNIVLYNYHYYVNNTVVSEKNLVYY